jgi:hypothetical protein
MRKVDPLKLLLLPLIPALGFGIVEVASRIGTQPSAPAHVSVDPQISFTSEISAPVVVAPELPPPAPPAEPCISCAMDT